MYVISFRGSVRNIIVIHPPKSRQTVEKTTPKILRKQPFPDKKRKMELDSFPGAVCGGHIHLDTCPGAYSVSINVYLVKTLSDLPSIVFV